MLIHHERAHIFRLRQTKRARLLNQSILRVNVAQRIFHQVHDLLNGRAVGNDGLGTLQARPAIIGFWTAISNRLTEIGAHQIAHKIRRANLAPGLAIISVLLIHALKLQLRRQVQRGQATVVGNHLTNACVINAKQCLRDNWTLIHASSNGVLQ